MSGYFVANYAGHDAEAYQRCLQKVGVTLQAHGADVLVADYESVPPKDPPKEGASGQTLPSACRTGISASGGSMPNTSRPRVVRYPKSTLVKLGHCVESRIQIGQGTGTIFDVGDEDNLLCNYLQARLLWCPCRLITILDEKMTRRSSRMVVRPLSPRC